MTNQNNAAQSVLTDKEIMDIMRYGQTDARLLQNGRAIESALLSNLRAPVADERAAYADPLSDFQEDQWWVKELDELARAPGATHDQKRAVAVVHHMLRSAALASAPVADDWTPTPANINALPEPVRDYVHQLIANADPAGTVAWWLRT